MAGAVRCANKIPQNFRSISTSNSRNDAWLSKIFVRKIEPTKESHSRMLSDKELIYALQTHNFRPDSKNDYLNNVKNTVELVRAQSPLKDDVELVGSWTVDVGDQDQALNLWKFTGGYNKVDHFNQILAGNSDYQRLVAEQGSLVRSRHLQYLLAFSYWPQIVSRQPKNLYEIRSYSLRPGTMIEWGNNWARAINYRQSNDEPFAGFFSQVGRLYNVHHIWCYKRLEERDKQEASNGHIWDECMAYTVPLIREMHARILTPNEISPTQ